MDPSSERPSGQYQPSQDTHRSPGRPSIHSPQGSRIVSQARPMNINNRRQDEPPPPLPPPRLVEGPDLGFQFATLHSNQPGQAHNIPISSSLHGNYLSKRESQGPTRKGSIPSRHSRAFPSHDVFQFSTSDETYASMSVSGDNQLQRDVPMEARNRKDSSHAYDMQLLSKLGRPKTPTQAASMGSQEGSPTSRRPSLQSAKPQLKNLSLSDRSLSLSSEPVFTPSLGSSKWASSPQSQSGGLISPGFASSAASHRSPTHEGSNLTSPSGGLPGSNDEAERFMRRTQPPSGQRSDSSLSMGLMGGSAGHSEEPGGAGNLSAGRANRSRPGRSQSHQAFQFSEEQRREQQTQQAVDEQRLEFLRLDDRSNSHNHPYPQQQQQQRAPPPPHTPSASHSSLPIHTHTHTHLGAQPQAASSHLVAGFVPHAHHPTLIAPQPPTSTHAPQQHISSPAQSRQAASQSRPGMPPSKRKHEEEDNTQDDRGAAGAPPASTQRRTSSQHHRRTSPAHPSQASYSSTSSVGLSNGSYASSTGISLGNSSLTSISPRERLSPSQLPPPNDHSDNRNSPRVNSLSLDPAMRASNSQSQSQSQPQSQSQSQPQPQSQSQPQSQPQSQSQPTSLPPPPQHTLSSTDAQATAAAAHNMASDHSVRQQQQTNAPQLQANLHICDCCPKKPKKFDTLEELRQHQAEKQYYCQYCHNRFKNKNEAERHQNSLHLRRHSWSCATLDRNYHTAFHPCTAIPPNTSATHSQQQQAQQAQYAEYDVCGYCGERFTNHPVDWVVRSQHLTTVHKFGECNQSKKFYRADHFRQHLKHSHGGQSGKWTNMLENACMREEPPLTPDAQGQDQIRAVQHQTQPQHVPPQPTEAQLQAQQAAAAAQAAARAAQAAQAATDQQQQPVKPEQPQQLMSHYDAAALQSAPVAVMGSSRPYPQMTTSHPTDAKYQTIKEDR